LNKFIDAFEICVHSRRIALFELQAKNGYEYESNFAMKQGSM